MKKLIAIVVVTTTALFGCTDPDVVPETHISTPPPPQASGTTVERYPLKTALYGDLHVHTSWSADAYASGNRLGPNTAYRFARGEEVELQNGLVTKLDAPLDFVALTDHAENFATHLPCTIGGGPEFDTEQCRAMRAGDLDQQAMLEQVFTNAGTRPGPRSPLCDDDLERCLATEKATWLRVQEAANVFDDPGTFSTLIGYEFSSLLANFGMLHRNVIFRGTEVTPHAISSNDVVNQADFFAQLDEVCQAPCEVLTIPHNTNFSWGKAFSRTDEDGSIYTQADIERRARIDRSFEITQQKGNSECQIGVGMADEDCNFENTWPVCDDGRATQCASEPSFLRNALLTGLAMGNAGGQNPYKLGVIASTDTHMSDPGNTARQIPAQFDGINFSFAVNRALELDHVVIGPIRKVSAGGLAGVWAEANTRAAIFDALRRRETFGTSGSRISLRFFAGSYAENMGDSADAIATAYANGVPMGSDLAVLEDPDFWVWASQDPSAPALDRIQVIKGWIEEGEEMQKVWDIACSGDRTPGKDGKCPATTASVDVESCELSGSGAAELQTTFTDPGFSPDQIAFYYVRVFENPSCRWTTALANKADVDRPTDIPEKVQHRAWSSPIWVNSP
ncbi:MAG: DUF3604 domain-containing protein [Pseudomonadales bacterium]|jgi:hypothetical protein|nr:DUF3604 domain-containing protein [Pseudomonadales bacterium]|tara:strand:+ start:2593 stop:4458 length:1866 start_codon:yes stop_codon:yes gene_type:complete